jgi:4-amino-4-deoxy-L-arabinose transferase-like glycosyltransferase
MSAKQLIRKIRLFFQDRHKLTITGLLTAVILLGTFLRFYNLGATGVGNQYYAAAVKSMLQSWHNFFYVAFEPGGSVSVDKPPLGFWMQALSAYFLGVTGFALALPNAIAGVLSIFLAYKLVRRPFGAWAGLAAALTLALMPVAISTERNNTIDGLLVFVLLLAAWAFLQSVYTGKIRWLFWGVFIVGLGFNIKMLQAYMPLPAFYALYFFGAKSKCWKKILNLAEATVLLLVVSFSWAIAVDLTPATERPYVDSTEHNTVMELIFGHNGIERLTNIRQGIGLDGRQNRQGQSNPSSYGQLPDSTNRENLAPSTGQGMMPGELQYEEMPSFPDGQGLPQGSGGQNPSFGEQGFPEGETPDGENQSPAGGPGFLQGFGGGGGPNGQMPAGGQPVGSPGGQPGGQFGSMGFGSAGALRLFTSPLVGEASWLLPFVLIGIVIIAIALWKLPFGEKHASAILWAGWLVPEIIYFSYSQGLMHAYYLIMLGAPIAALVGMTFWALWQIIQKRCLLGWILSGLLTVGTLAFQAYSITGQTSFATWAIGAAGALFITGIILAAFSGLRVHLAPVGLGFLLAAMLVAPAVWSGLTLSNKSANAGLPYAGPSQQRMPGGMISQRNDDIGNRTQVPNNSSSDENSNQQSQYSSLLDYLLANTEPGTYLVATDTANDAASYILATGRPVLTFGGFLGQYQEVTVDQVSALVKSGKLRFILGQSAQKYTDIFQWVQENCKVVDTSTLIGSGNAGGQVPSTNLYDCGN